MRFETSQHMKMGQHMKLAPRMIQSMEILQMPLTELEERIERELESNATLEVAEGEPETIEGGGANAEPSGDIDGPMRIDEKTSEVEFERLDSFEDANPDAAENTNESSRLLDGRDRFDRLRAGPRPHASRGRARRQDGRDGRGPGAGAASCVSSSATSGRWSRSTRVCASHWAS